MIRKFQESDFSTQNNSWFRWEGGDGVIYPAAYQEDNRVFRQMIAAFPQGCLAATNSQDQLIGYAFGFPWRCEALFPLNCRQFKLPDKPTCYYVHDVAVLPKYQGMGIGKALAEEQIRLAVGMDFSTIKLVSVLDSQPFWTRMGFVEAGAVPYGLVQTGYVMFLELE